MSIDTTRPFNFLKTMKLSNYNHIDDFFLDFRVQLEKHNELTRLKEENKMMREFLDEVIDIAEFEMSNSDFQRLAEIKQMVIINPERVLKDEK